VGQFELNHWEMSTPKALANSSPGLLQPWGPNASRIVTLKALAKGKVVHDLGTPSEFEIVVVFYPGLKQPLGWN